ncbi:MAG: M48 family metallopeptidase [Bacteroidales bacterium]|nr:M48 family metallopeptidase [Bacteroidales bacterium]
MAQTLFYIIIAIILFDYILERVLDYLNSTYWSDELPAELKGIYEAEKYKKSQDYEKVTTRFSILTGTLSLLAMLGMLFFGGFAWLDDFVRSYTTNPILMALLFFGILGLAADILTTPFSVYSTFVIEQKFGFNKMTVKTFILDKLKGWLLAAIIGGGLLALIVWIYESTGEWFWLIAWGAISSFTIITQMFGAEIFIPLFNKLTPLKNEELESSIKDLVNKTGYNLKNIKIIDGSKRTTKENAAFTGLGPKKKVLLYDTLLEKHINQEVTAVLAHEIGHYKMKHTLIFTILGLIHWGVIFFILSIFLKYPVFAHALGAEEANFHMSILAFGLLYGPISLVLGLLMNILSRKNEFAADRYAGLNFKPEPLKSALIKLSVNHLSNLKPHPAYVFFYYSHPPLLERLSALDKLKT